MNEQFPYLKSGCYIKGETGPTGPQGVMGPTGPKGDQGIGESILLGKVSTVDSNEDAKIIDHKIGTTHVLDFAIPKGCKGDNGTSVTILGSYDNLEELKKEHTKGNKGDAYLIGEYLYVWDEANNTWDNVGVIRGPKGDQGPPGPLCVPTAVFTKFNKNTNGEEIQSKQRIPLDSKLGDEMDQFILNQDNTITFINSGTYYVNFVIQAHPINGTTYKDDHDMIAIGFKKVGNETIYAGGSTWDNDQSTVHVIGQGMIYSTSNNQKFELVNLGKYPIFLDSPPSAYTYTWSSYINPVVSLTIQRTR